MKFFTTKIQKKLAEYFDKIVETCNFKIETVLNIDNEKKQMIVNKLKEDFKEMSKRQDETSVLASSEFSAILSYRVLHFLIEQFYDEVEYYFVEKEKTPSYLKRMIRQLSENNRTLTGIEINPFAKIGIGFCIVDGSNCVIGERCIIGTNFTIHKDVVLGVRPNDSSLKIYKTQAEKDYNRHPKIGDNVEIKENSKILGNIHIGDNVIIESGCTVLKSMPNNAIISTYQSMQLYRYKDENPRKPRIFLVKYSHPNIIIKGINLNEITISLIDSNSHHKLAKKDFDYQYKSTNDEINIKINHKNEAIREIGLLLFLDNRPKLLIKLVLKRANYK